MGEPATGLYQVVQGAILERIAGGPQDTIGVISRVAGPGEYFGLDGLEFDSSQTRSASAIAVTDSVVAHIPDEVLRMEMSESSKLITDLSRQVIEAIREGEERTALLGEYNSGQRRVTEAISEFYRIGVMPTQTTIGERAGVERRRVVKTVQHLSALGLVASVGHGPANRLVVCDPVRLKRQL